MPLLDLAIRRALLANGEAQQRARNGGRELDHRPVVKLFTPDAAATWLLSELEPADPDVAFGLCDLGLGEPELGNMRISELEALRGRLGLKVERDLYFRPKKTISEYAREARRSGRIVSDPS